MTLTALLSCQPPQSPSCRPFPCTLSPMASFSCCACFGPSWQFSLCAASALTETSSAFTRISCGTSQVLLSLSLCVFFFLFLSVCLPSTNICATSQVLCRRTLRGISAHGKRYSRLVFWLVSVHVFGVSTRSDMSLLCCLSCVRSTLGGVPPPPSLSIPPPFGSGARSESGAPPLRNTQDSTVTDDTEGSGSLDYGWAHASIAPGSRSVSNSGASSRLDDTFDKAGQ